MEQIITIFGQNLGIVIMIMQQMHLVDQQKEHMGECKIGEIVNI